MKYGLSPRKFPRAQPEGTYEGSDHVSYRVVFLTANADRRAVSFTLAE